MPKAVRKEIERLQREIRHHDYLYYVEAAPEITDLAYDRLMQRLAALEQEHPELVRPDSPTQRVAGGPIVSFRPARHHVPMLSIDNTYSEAELRQFDERVRHGLKGATPRYVVEHKIDGVSVSLVYERGTLKTGATRGDGHTGDDVAHNLRTVRGVPLCLAIAGQPPRRLEVRGEVYMTNTELSRLNHLQSKRGNRLFANPRNAAAGSLKLLNATLCAQRRLRFFAHSEGDLDGLLLINHLAFLNRMRMWGLPVVPHSALLMSIDEVIEFATEHFEARHALDYETDGVVGKVNDFAQRQQLGESTKAPRWAIAYKVELWQASTLLRKVHVQVGKTGVLTPVGTLTPVPIAGSIISRVTLHNADEIKRKDIRIGDRVVVEKAGKVIPHVVRVELERRKGTEKPFRFPRRCPACRGPVERDPGGVYVRCLNASCPGQLKEHLRYFAHREAMDIEGLGPALVDQLVDRGLVRSLPDLYRLRHQDLKGQEHIGLRSAEKLCRGIEESKSRGLHRLLTGLGIRHIGSVTRGRSPTDLARFGD